MNCSRISPVDYPTDNEWDARMMIERSIAVKCPSIASHLAGSKKVQQALAEPAVLEHFLGQNNSKTIDILRSVFAGLFSLDPIDNMIDPKARELAILARHEALKKPELYVMKPQREGGGNNLYGQELHRNLSTLTPEELSAYILMERILPPLQQATLMRDGKTATVCYILLFIKGIVFICTIF
jgi:glutathione synthase